VTLTFLGAAGEVTGSCHLVDTGRVRFLMDCGMFQGRDAGQKNYARFRFAPREIAFVLVSHAHIDHSGLLPRLVAAGFAGPIYATAATCDLLGAMLPDSAYLHERDAAQEGGRPLYTVGEARASLARLVPVGYGVAVEPEAGLRFVFREPGHPIVRDATPVAAADVLLVESTYGDRLHKDLAGSLEEFAFALTDTLAGRGGNVVIPAFAVGRTQDMLYFISRLHREGRLPDLDVYVDSPMALAATRITLRHSGLYDREGKDFLDWLRSGQERKGLRIHFTESVEDSMRINSIRSGAVILAASGMCEGGRVRHHLHYNLPRPECAIVFAGFQAAGTLGRSLVDGAATVRLRGEPHPVRARVFTIGGLSAHADRAALIAWLKGFRRAPRQTWVVHGEDAPARALRDEARRWGWSADIPSPHQSVEAA
jgi:metallo-beta-lactamase family protein